MRIFIRLFLCCMLLFAVFIPTVQAKDIPYVRIVAHSDSPESQTIKYKARHDLLQLLYRNPSLLHEPLQLQQQLQNIGYPATVHYQTWSPSPVYPAKNTLYITLGSGHGHNWWGVLTNDVRHWSFLQANEKSGALSSAAHNTYQLSFSIWEKICHLFAFCQNHLQV